MNDWRTYVSQFLNQGQEPDTPAQTDTTTDPSSLVDSAPDWAKDELRKKLANEQSPSFLSQALSLVGKGVDEIKNTPISTVAAQLTPVGPAAVLADFVQRLRGESIPGPTVEDYYHTTEIPKQVAGEAIRENVPGLPGRVAASATESVLDPLNIALMGVGVGEIGIAKQIGLAAAAGAGSELGGEVLGTPGAFAGGLVGLGVGGSLLSRLANAKIAATDTAARAAMRAADTIESVSPAIADSLRNPFIKTVNDRFPQLTLDDGSVANLVDWRGLNDEIRGYQARDFYFNGHPELAQSTDEMARNSYLQWASHKDEIGANVSALQMLQQYMGSTGQRELPLTDMWDTARALAGANAGASEVGEWVTRSSEAVKRAAQLRAALESSPNIRFQNVGQGTLSELFRQELSPEIQTNLQTLQGLRQQAQSSQSVVDQSAQGVAQATGNAKEQAKNVLASLPTGARTAGRDYFSALIGGDESRIAAMRTRLLSLSQMRGSNPDDVISAFDDAANFHRSALEGATTHAELLSSHNALQGMIKEAQANSSDAIQKAYSAADALKQNLLQPENSRNLYRMATLTTTDAGQLAADFRVVNPSATARDAIGAGAALDVGEKASLGEAQANLADLLAQRASARKVGGLTPEDNAAWREKITDAQRAVKDLNVPSRPIPVGQLPESPGRLIVPVNDLQKFTVFKPGTVTPNAFLKEGLRDSRTVGLLNDQTRLNLTQDQLTQSIKAAQDQLGSLRIQPNEVEQQLLQQGITDGVRPEIIRGYQQQAQLQEQVQIAQAQLAQNSTELAAIDQRILSSHQALEATVQNADYEANFAQEQLAASQQRYAAQYQKFQDSLNLSPGTMAAKQADLYKAGIDYQLAGILGKIPTDRRMTQAAFDSLLQRSTDFAITARNILPKASQEELAQFIQNAEVLLPNMEARAAVKMMMAPYQSAELNLDPDNARTGLLGWVNHVVMGAGFKTPVFDGIDTTLRQTRTSASVAAGMDWAGLEHQIGRAADVHLGKLAGGTDELSAWARSVQKLPTNQRLPAYISNMALSIESNPWQTALTPLREAGVPEDMLTAIYNQAQDKFAIAALHPNLFNMRKGIQEVGMNTREWGKRYSQLTDLTNNTGVARQLIREEFRKYLPTGRLQLENGAVDLPKGSRNWLTDLAEIQLNAAADARVGRNLGTRAWLAGNESLPTALRYQGGALPLDRMMIAGDKWGETLAANQLHALGEDAAYQKLAEYLKNPKDVAKLRSGEALTGADWTNPDMADDWAKLKGVLNQDTPTGLNATLQQITQGVRSVSAGVVAGDLNIMGNQGLSLAAISPSAAGKLATDYFAKHLSTDVGAHAWLADPENYDFLRMAISRGMSVGGKSLFGGDLGRNIWQYIPGPARVMGDAINHMDDVAFSRVMTPLKLAALKTHLQTMQDVTNVLTREQGAAWVDGMPALKNLHSASDLWNSPTQDKFDAAVRLVENQFGGGGYKGVGATRQAIENTLLFVPGFFRAKAGLINQVSRALRDPSSPEGWLAASILAREAAFRLSMGAAIAGVTGTSDKYREEVASMQAFDPRQSGGMLRGPLGDGGYLGLSWGNSAPKLYAQLLAGQKPGQANLNPMDRLAAAKSFFEGRENPVIRAAIEQTSGKDFFGRPVKTPQERLAAISGSVLPIWMGTITQDASDQLLKDGHLDPKSLAADTAAQFVGLNYRAAQPYDVLNNRFQAWQQKQFPGEPTVDWRDSTGDLKRMAKAANPDVKTAEDSWLYDLNRKKTDKDIRVDQTFNVFQQEQGQADQKQAKMSSLVQSGQMSPADWKKGYSSLQQDRADAADYLNRGLIQNGVDLGKSSTAKLPNGLAPQVALALSEYRQVRPQPIQAARFTENGTVLDQDVDWAKFAKDRSAVLAKYPESIRAQVQQYLEPTDPVAQQAKAAQQSLATYMDTIPKYQGLSPEEGKYVDFIKGSLNSIAAQVRDSGAQVDQDAIFRAGLRELANSGKITNPAQSKLAALAYQMASNPQTTTSMRNPASLQFILDNPSLLQWYPWMAGELPQMFHQLLPPEARKTADIDQIQSRNLRGVDLAMVGQ